VSRGSAPSALSAIPYQLFVGNCARLWAEEYDRYDTTGRTDDLPFADAGSMGWDAYFESLFQRVDRKMLDDDKARYQGWSSFFPAPFIFRS